MDRSGSSAPLVSVCLITYMHEAFITKCIESILAQQCNFEFEIIIGEDGSTDGTLAICRSYEAKYPGIIRLFSRSRNDVIYVNGIPTGRFNFTESLKSARGKYIALCEGDDYWSDPMKLQKQVNFLETNADCVVCHAWHEYAYQSENGYVVKPAPVGGHGYLPAEKSSVKEIFDNKLRVKSRTIMFRNVLKEIPSWFYKIRFGDVALSMLLGKHGDFGFINEPVAVYRHTGVGASTVGKEKPDFLLDQFSEWIRIWEYGFMHYDYRFQKEALNTIYSFYETIFRNYNYSFKIFRKMLHYSVFKSRLKFILRLRVAARITSVFLKGRPARKQSSISHSTKAKR
jgi:glycosyltransferase involved in cell wall biosynthesis